MLMKKFSVFMCVFLLSLSILHFLMFVGDDY